MNNLCGTNHESDGSLLIYIDGDVGALDPGVGAQMSQSNVRVPARQPVHFHFTLLLVGDLHSVGPLRLNNSW